MRTTRHIGIERRSFLVGGLSLAVGAGFPGLSASALQRAQRGRQHEGGERTLVLIQLGGGNDGLSTVVPYADDAYGRSRSRTRIDAKEVLRIDDYRGLHPRLGNLHTLHQAGRLAIVEGVGYPGPVRSHFKAMDIWHAASEHGRVAGDGWVGRLAARAWPESSAPELLVHVGRCTPYSLHSRAHRAVAFELPESYRWLGDAQENQAYADYTRESTGEGAPSQSSVLERLRGSLRDAQASSARVRQAVDSYRTRVDYPNDDFGRGLRVIASLLEARIGARVLSIELSGFDTHNQQRADHDRLMARLDAGLGAFFRDLRGRSIEKDTVLLAFSEFGRRVAENGSLGTDHGKAAPVFVAGAAVNGGLHGRHPSLVELDEGDLAFDTDFRSIYASVAEGWFGVPQEDVLGARYPLLPLFQRA